MSSTHIPYSFSMALLQVWIGIFFAPAWVAADSVDAADTPSEIGVEEDVADTAEEPRGQFTGATEVLASRLTADPVAAGRREIIVTRSEIEALPVASVQDLLTASGSMPFGETVLGFALRLDHVWLKLEASNVFDRNLTELHGIPLPGRWASLSVSYRKDR